VSLLLQPNLSHRWGEIANSACVIHEERPILLELFGVVPEWLLQHLVGEDHADQLDLVCFLVQCFIIQSVVRCDESDCFKHLLSDDGRSHISRD